MFAPLGLVALFGLTAPTTATGCALDCTLIGWFEGLTVSVESPGGLADGTYLLATEADGVELSVAIKLQGGIASCPTPGSGGSRCEAAASAGRDRVLRASVEGTGPSPARLSLNLYYTDGGDFDGGPEVARIRVVRDGDTLGARSFEPDYRREEINGRGCGVATQAEAVLTLSP